MKIKNILICISIILVFNNVYGQFGNPVIIDNGISTNKRNILIFDVDNDSNKDLVISSFFDDIVWYKNTGSGFLSAQSITSSIQTPYHLESGDINGDNYSDLLVTNNSGNNSSVSVFINNGGGISWTELQLDSNLLIGAFKSFFIDVDNDGDLDVVTNSDTKITLYKNNGIGTFASPLIIENMNEYYSTTVGDFTNDGYTDIVVNTATAGIVIFENDSNGFFNSSVTIANGLRIFLTSCDFDKDSNIDVVSGSSTNNMEIDFFNNDGSGIFNYSFSENDADAMDVTNSKTIFSDINNNTFIDLLYINNYSIYVKHNSQTGLFNTATFINNQYDYSIISSDDIDYDGDNDIVWFAYDFSSSSYKLGYILNEIILGLNDPLLENEINVFPNPTSGIVMINEVITKWTVYNAIGQILKTDSHFTVDISELKSGMYFLKLQTKDDQIFVKRIIKK